MVKKPGWRKTCRQAGLVLAREWGILLDKIVLEFEN